MRYHPSDLVLLLLPEIWREANGGVIQVRADFYVSPGIVRRSASSYRDRPMPQSEDVLAAIDVVRNRFGHLTPSESVAL